MAINERLVHTASAAGTGNQEEGLILHLDANDVDSYDGDGDVWYDIHDHEYTPATNVSEHFNTVTYTGNDGINEITGVGFQPDLVWIKRRNSSTYNHVIRDSVRGTDSVLSSDTNNAESVVSNRFEFITDGFKHLVGTQGANNSAGTYVAWCFKAGGAPTTTNTATSGAMTANSVSIDGVLESSYTPSGSPDIYPDKMSVNTDLGFSVIQYGGSGAQETLPHGLGQNPELMIFKRTNTAASWLVSDGTSMGYLDLNDSFSTTRHNQYINSVDANTIEINNVAGINGSSDEMIAYCFASKRGVSKVGSYIGTGASGNKIYTGFEPAFLLQKETNTSGVNWHIWDNVRDSNPIENILIPNTNSAEGSVSSGITFNRDGFTINTTNGSINGNGDNYIYYAVAKSTNETDLIDDTDLELHLDPASYSGSGTTWSDLANSNDGTISGAYYDEELGDWFDFDGSNDNVTISPTSFNSASALTVEAWLNKDNNNAFYTFTTLRGTASNSVKFLLALNINGTLRLDSASGTNFLTLYSGNAAYYTTVGKWHHVAASIDYNSKDWAIYLDGKKIANGTNASIRGATQFNPDLFAIGMNYNQQYFNGQIGQYRVYDSVLSETDIRQNFNFTKNDYPNGFNGTLTSMSGSNWNSSGYFNLTTNDYIDLTGNAPFSSSTTQTDTVKCVTGWIKPDTSTSRVHLYSVSSTSSSNDFLQIGWFNDLSLFRVNVRNGTSNQDSLKDVTITPTTNWVHIVVQVTDTTTEIYFNGNSQTVTFDNDGSGTNTSWISFVSYASGVKHSIGRSRVVNPSWSDGSISKVKIYDKVLTQAEITALYDEGE